MHTPKWKKNRTKVLKPCSDLYLHYTEHLIFLSTVLPQNRTIWTFLDLYFFPISGYKLSKLKKDNFTLQSLFLFYSDSMWLDGTGSDNYWWWWLYVVLTLFCTTHHISAVLAASFFVSGTKNEHLHLGITWFHCFCPRGTMLNQSWLLLLVWRCSESSEEVRKKKTDSDLSTCVLKWPEAAFTEVCIFDP